MKGLRNQEKEVFGRLGRKQEKIREGARLSTHMNLKISGRISDSVLQGPTTRGLKMGEDHVVFMQEHANFLCDNDSSSF